MKSKYNWDKVQEFYDTGKSAAECRSHFGMAHRTFQTAIKRGNINIRTRSESMSLAHLKRGPHSQETKDKLRTVALKRGFGGRNYRKTFQYNGIILESSYELALAQELDKHGIRWIRPKRFMWTDQQNRTRFYTPDFFLTDYDVYLDPKNDYLIKIDTDKINRVCKENGIRVLVLNKNQLTWSYIACIV